MLNNKYHDGLKVAGATLAAVVLPFAEDAVLVVPSQDPSR